VTDVFIANGTAWFYSRGGKRPWEFLHASTKNIKELGFADIDNDGVTDVLYRDPQGNIGYLKGGRGDLIALTTSPVPLKDMRFGDFDADGKTDIFITHQGKWQVWYGATKAWKEVNTSSKNISELLFGNFDRVPGADVATVLSDRWAISSAATSSWNFLNKRFATTFKNAIAADFDGNGFTDIAYRGLGRWQVSADGQGEPRALGLPFITREYGLVGRFDKTSPRAMIIYNAPNLLLGTNHFKIWRGYGTTVDWRDWSDHDMR